MIKKKVTGVGTAEKRWLREISALPRRFPLGAAHFLD
jgi:hypothetical protein